MIYLFQHFIYFIITHLTFLANFWIPYNLLIILHLIFFTNSVVLFLFLITCIFNPDEDLRRKTKLRQNEHDFTGSFRPLTAPSTNFSKKKNK